MNSAKKKLWLILHYSKGQFWPSNPVASIWHINVLLPFLLPHTPSFPLPNRPLYQGVFTFIQKSFSWTQVEQSKGSVSLRRSKQKSLEQAGEVPLRSTGNGSDRPAHARWTEESDWQTPKCSKFVWLEFAQLRSFKAASAFYMLPSMISASCSTLLATRLLKRNRLKCILQRMHLKKIIKLLKPPSRLQ